jgi:hypothetical protein
VPAPVFQVGSTCNFIRFMRDVRITSWCKRDLGFYASWNSNFLPTFPDNLSVQSSRMTLEDGTARLCRDVTKKTTILRCVNPKKRRSRLQVVSALVASVDVYDFVRCGSYLSLRSLLLTKPELTK